MMKRNVREAIMIGSIVGGGLGVGFLMFAFLTAFSICPDTWFAEVLFPFVFVAFPSLYDHLLIAFLLAICQYPLYGAFLGLVWARSRYPLIMTILIMSLGHMAAVVVAHHRVATMWEQTFQSNP